MKVQQIKCITVISLDILWIRLEYIQSLYKGSYDASKEIFLPYKIVRESHIG